MKQQHLEALATALTNLILDVAGSQSAAGAVSIPHPQTLAELEREFSEFKVLPTPKSMRDEFYRAYGTACDTTADTEEAHKQEAWEAVHKMMVTALSMSNTKEWAELKRQRDTYKGNYEEMRRSAEAVQKKHGEDVEILTRQISTITVRANDEQRRLKERLTQREQDFANLMESYRHGQKAVEELRERSRNTVTSADAVYMKNVLQAHGFNKVGDDWVLPSPWISCAERMPTKEDLREPHGLVLWYFSYGGTTGYKVSGYYQQPLEATYWMIMPPVPKWRELDWMGQPKG